MRCCGAQDARKWESTTWRATSPKKPCGEEQRGERRPAETDLEALEYDALHAALLDPEPPGACGFLCLSALVVWQGFACLFCWHSSSSWAPLCRCGATCYQLVARGSPRPLGGVVLNSTTGWCSATRYQPACADLPATSLSPGCRTKGSATIQDSTDATTVAAHNSSATYLTFS